MKPFLLAVVRPPGAIAHDERAAILRYGRLVSSQLEALDLLTPAMRLPELARYSGVIITGSPYSYLAPVKSDTHKATEQNLQNLCSFLLARDFPTLGLCFGFQMLALVAGAQLTRDYPEEMAAHTIQLTAAGISDPLTGKLPRTFRCYSAHDDAVTHPPESLTVLASNPAVPVHIGRIGAHIYGTQHHPEIGRTGIALRVSHYAGTYFPADSRESVLAACQRATVEHGIITHFVSSYGVS